MTPAARARDDHPTRSDHPFSKLGRRQIIRMILGSSRRAENARLPHIAVGREHLDRISQFFQAFVQQLEIAAVGLVAQQLEGVGDHLTDDVPVGNAGELFDQIAGGLVYTVQVRAGKLGRGFRRFQVFFRAIKFLHV